MKKLILSTMGLLATGMLSAQIYISETPLSTSNVTNEGVAVGFDGNFNTPFYLWDAINNTTKLIGGVSAGNGVGGDARFSGDGKKVVAPNHFDNIPVNTQWEPKEFSAFKGYNFNSTLKLSDYNIFGLGTDASGEKGILIKTANNGVSWRKGDYVVGAPDGNNTPRPLICGARSGYTQVVLGGADGALYTTSGNGQLNYITIAPEGVENNVKNYYAIDFIYNTGDDYAKNGVFGIENKDGSYAVWYTDDEATTYHVATGVAGVPRSITHVGDVFWMGTANGVIQKSEDLGATWTAVYTLPSNGLIKQLRFQDDSKGFALTDSELYLTFDGGKTWSKSVLNISDNTTLNGAAWGGDVITIVGNNATAYRSADNGNTYTKVILGNNAGDNFGTVYYDRDVWNVLTDNGVFYRKSDKAAVAGHTASLYSVDDDTWTPLASSGYDQQGTFSSPWNISRDVNHVVGIIYDYNNVTKNVQAYAAIWNGTEEFVRLGNMFTDQKRSARANAVSYDGSVVAGWQDIFGPWFGSVWRKGADGNYTQSLMYADESKRKPDIDLSEDKDFAMKELLGYCQVVSEDGKWFGGNGNDQTAVHGPWLWNEEQGLIVIDGDLSGCVSGLSNDGTTAVGWDGQGQGAWIWTKEMGKMELNDYAKNVLNVEYDDFYIGSVYAMSPNGRYVTGYGFSGRTPLGYVLDLRPIQNGIEAIEANQVKAAVYPNPVSSELHVDVPYGNGEVATTMRLFDMQGRAVMSRQLTEASNSFSVENLAAGMYILRVEAGRSSKVFKVVVRH